MGKMDFEKLILTRFIVGKKSRGKLLTMLNKPGKRDRGMKVLVKKKKKKKRIGLENN